MTCSSNVAMGYHLQWFCGQNPLIGVLETFSHWYLCVKFENVMKSTTKKKKNNTQG